MKDAMLLAAAAANMEAYAVFASPELAKIFSEAGSAFSRASGLPRDSGLELPSSPLRQRAAQQSHLN